jgi:hypothetical protein
MRWLFPVDPIRFNALLIHHIGTPGAKADNKWLNRHRINESYFIDDFQDAIQSLVARAAGRS